VQTQFCSAGAELRVVGGVWYHHLLIIV